MDHPRQLTGLVTSGDAIADSYLNLCLPAGLTLFHATAYANVFGPEEIHSPSYFAPNVIHPSLVLIEHSSGRDSENRTLAKQQREKRQALKIHEYVLIKDFLLTHFTRAQLRGLTNMDELDLPLTYGVDMVYERSHTILSSVLSRVLSTIYDRFKHARQDSTPMVIVNGNPYGGPPLFRYRYDAIDDDVYTWFHLMPNCRLWDISSEDPLRMTLALREFSAASRPVGASLVAASAALDSSSAKLTFVIEGSTTVDPVTFLLNSEPQYQEVYHRIKGIALVQLCVFDAPRKRLANGFNVVGYDTVAADFNDAGVMNKIDDFLVRCISADPQNKFNTTETKVAEMIKYSVRPDINDADYNSWFHPPDSISIGDDIPADKIPRDAKVRYDPSQFHILLPWYALDHFMLNKLPRFRAAIQGDNRNKKNVQYVLHFESRPPDEIKQRQREDDADDDDDDDDDGEPAAKKQRTESVDFMSAMLALGRLGPVDDNSQPPLRPGIIDKFAQFTACPAEVLARQPGLIYALTEHHEKKGNVNNFLAQVFK